MAGFLPLNIVTIIVALFVTFGFCMQFDDILLDQKYIPDDISRQLDYLRQKVFADRAEIEDWQNRVKLLEKHIEDTQADKHDVLSRHKRGIRDPRYGMFVGRPGRKGLPGSSGVPGAIGRRGQKGHKGVAGPPGLRGPPGPYGPPGWQGPPGFIGADGIKGEEGLSGFDGIPGLIGDVGLAGYNGHHGQMGPPGEMGHVGFIGMPGPPGLRGDPGVIGYMGPPGQFGNIGVPGPVGFYGEPGPMGETGFMGPPGELGFKGLKGERGMEGEIGSWGPIGRPGPVYDPYAGMFQPMPMMSKHQVAVEGNCSDLDDGVPNCSSFEGIPMAEAPPYSSKVLPVFAHPPPGAHVMPAQPVFSKVYMPGMYDQHRTPAEGPPVATLDQEKDILTEKEYLELLKSGNTSYSDTLELEDEYEDMLNETEIDDATELQDLNETSKFNESSESQELNDAEYYESNVTQGLREIEFNQTVDAFFEKEDDHENDESENSQELTEADYSYSEYDEMQSYSSEENEDEESTEDSEESTEEDERPEATTVTA